MWARGGGDGARERVTGCRSFASCTCAPSSRPQSASERVDCRSGAGSDRAGASRDAMRGQACSSEGAGRAAGSVDADAPRSTAAAALPAPDERRRRRRRGAGWAAGVKAL
eukprot:357165-Chlamydomonas_euryale.AAC.3